MQTRSQALAELRFDLCSLPEPALLCVLQLLAPKKDCVYLATTCKQLYRLFPGDVQLACVQAMHKRLFKTKGQQQLYLCPTRTLRLCRWLFAEKITMQEFWIAQDHKPCNEQRVVTITFLTTFSKAVEASIRKGLATKMPSLGEALNPLNLQARLHNEYTACCWTLWTNKDWKA